jgi:glucose/arabinose dehydrogenase
MTQQFAFDFGSNASNVKAIPASTTNTNIDHQASEDLPTLKRRVYTSGHRHGKAFGNVGVVTVQYSKGFADGFMSAFKQ